MRNAMVERMQDVLAGGLEQACRLGAAAGKIHFVQRETLGCGFEAGRLKRAETAQGASYTVTVLLNGRRASATGSDPADLEEMVSRAVTLARAGSAAHFDAYPPPAETTPVEKWSAETLALTRDDLVAACGRIVEALGAYDADLFIEAGAERAESEGLLMTTSGLCRRTTSTNWSLGAWAQRTAGTDMLFAGAGRSWCRPEDLFDPAALAGEILTDLRRGERIAEPPRGPCTALLSPEVVAMLMWAVEMGVNGRNVAKGDSPLRGRLGERVLDASVTLLDDPHVPYAPGAAETDADGVPTRRTEIIRDGVLRQFLYDLDSAGLAGAEPTGHDGCRPHFPVVCPGEAPHERLLEGISDGLYVKQLIGFGQGNLINGDFSCNVALGFRVRGGEVVGRVKNVMMAGNVYELLGSNVRLSCDVRPALRMPWALVEGLNIAARE